MSTKCLKQQQLQDFRGSHGPGFMGLRATRWVLVGFGTGFTNSSENSVFGEFIFKTIGTAGYFES